MINPASLIPTASNFTHLNISKTTIDHSISHLFSNLTNSSGKSGEGNSLPFWEVGLLVLGGIGGGYVVVKAAQKVFLHGYNVFVWCYVGNVW